MDKLPINFEEEVLKKHDIWWDDRLKAYIKNGNVIGYSPAGIKEFKQNTVEVELLHIAVIALEAMTSDGLGHVFRHQNSEGEYFYRFGGQFIYGDIADKILGKWSSVSGILAKEKLEEVTQSKEWRECIFKAVKEIYE